MWGIISDVYHQQPAENISPCFGYKPVSVTPSNLLNYMWLSKKWLRTKGIPILVCVTMKFTSLKFPHFATAEEIVWQLLTTTLASVCSS